MKTKSVLRRRNFVKTFALFTAYSCIGGKKLASLFVTDIAAQSTSQIGIFRINFDNFPQLQSDFGSVRLAVTGMVATFPEIIVTRVPGNTFYAVTSRCTHQGCTVEPYGVFSQTLECPCHGSQYAPSGTVIRGPAPSSLTRYQTTFDGDKTLAIAIPGLGYSATIAAVANPATGGTRIRLEFPTVRNLQYEVRFRASLAEGDWTQVPFSTTADGAASETVFSGTNTRATIYVDGSNEGGFYAVIRY